MNILSVIEQMCVMLILILIGYFLFRKEKLSEESTRHISALVANVCNPALLICSAFEEGERVSLAVLGQALLVNLFLYAVLLLAGVFISRIMESKKEDRWNYHFLTVYGNVGFMGIPIASAVLGNNALIFVSINVLLFNILFYTSGLGIIQKKAGVRRSGLMSMVINSGTVSALLTIVFYLGNFPVPGIIRNVFSYTGRATTLLSMLVLGVAVAQLPLKEFFSHKKDGLFVLLRMILLPAACILVLKQVVTNPLILGTAALLISMPCANLPLMSSKEYGLDTSVLARTIVLTTLVSVITLPLVMLLIAS